MNIAQIAGLKMATQGSLSLADVGVTGMHTYKGIKEAEAATNEANRLLQQAQEQQLGYLQPFYNVSSKAARTLSDLLEQEYPIYKPEQFNYKQSPEYQLQRAEGMEAIQAQAAATGQIFNANTIKALQKYGAKQALLGYQQALDDYLKKQQVELERVKMEQAALKTRQEIMNDLVRQGYMTGSQMSDIIEKTQTKIAENRLNLANARLAAIMGMANAWSKNFARQSNILESGFNLMGGYSAGKSTYNYNQPQINTETNTGINNIDYNALYNVDYLLG